MKKYFYGSFSSVVYEDAKETQNTTLREDFKSRWSIGPSNFTSYSPDTIKKEGEILFCLPLILSLSRRDFLMKAAR